MRFAGRGHREKEFRYKQEEISKSELSRKGKAISIGSKIPISGKLQSEAAEISARLRPSVGTSLDGSDTWGKGCEGDGRGAGWG